MDTFFFYLRLFICILIWQDTESHTFLKLFKRNTYLNSATSSNSFQDTGVMGAASLSKLPFGQGSFTKDDKEYVIVVIIAVFDSKILLLTSGVLVHKVVAYF